MKHYRINLSPRRIFRKTSAATDIPSTISILPEEQEHTSTMTRDGEKSESSSEASSVDGDFAAFLSTPPSSPSRAKKQMDSPPEEAAADNGMIMTQNRDSGHTTMETEEVGNSKGVIDDAVAIVAVKNNLNSNISNNNNNMDIDDKVSNTLSFDERSEVEDELDEFSRRLSNQDIKPARTRKNKKVGFAAMNYSDNAKTPQVPPYSSTVTKEDAPPSMPTTASDIEARNMPPDTNTPAQIPKASRKAYITKTASMSSLDSTIKRPRQIQNKTSAELGDEQPRDWSAKTKDLPAHLRDLPDNAKELKCGGARRRQLGMWYRQKIQPFQKIAIAQIVCVIYILVLTFSYPPVGIVDPATNNIIDPNSVENTNNGVIYVEGSYRPVVAIGGWQKFCLAISRMSAFSMYPMIVAVFITKMKALQSFFVKTPLSMYFGVINAGHDFHVHAGRYIAFDVWLHTLFHLLRWASQGNIKLLWTSAAGLSGLTTMVAIPLITFPMMYFKRRISYEIRKGLHYLFYVFAIAMCFHVPTTAIPNGGFLAPVLGTCIVLYTLDASYVYLFMTEKIETTAFHVLSSGVRISMPVSKRFQKQADGAGFAYINLPWINDKQWHAFSLFNDPSDPSTQQMFLLKSGDWTTAVHTALSRDTTRPCWIKGPFPSPYSHASLYDNQILVASGIGITPALAAINAFKSSRRVNLIWAVRDPEMLEFFLEHMYLDHDGWNLIFYTGKKPLNSSIESSNTNVKVIRGRPDLASVIPNVIYGIEFKEGLPEKYTESSKDAMKETFIRRVSELDIDSSVSATNKVALLREYGEELGFSLQDMIDEINKSSAANATTKGLKSSLLMTYAELDESDLESPAADDNAENFLSELRSSMQFNKQFSLADLKEDVPTPKCTPKYHRGESLEHWTTVRNAMDERDFNSLLTPAFQPWEEDKEQEKLVKRLDDNDVMSTWGIMYCGGSKPVISALREVSMDYNIDLHIDSFAW